MGSHCKARSVLGVTATAGRAIGAILLDPLVQHAWGAGRAVIGAVHIGALAHIALRRRTHGAAIAGTSAARHAHG